MAFWSTVALQSTFRCRAVAFLHYNRTVSYPRTLQAYRYYSNGSSATAENINVGHSGFLAEASPGTKWKGEGTGLLNGGLDNGAEDFDSLTEGKGEIHYSSYEA